MALQVASWLDEVAFKKEWSDLVSITLHNALASVKVSAGYSILVTIANRSYVIESGTSTRLTIRSVPEKDTWRAMAKAKVRVLVSSDALNDAEDMGDDWNEVMMEKRKLQIQGDQAMYNQLQKELAIHMSTLQRKVQDAGPGEMRIKNAIEQHNAAIGASGKELSMEFAEQLTVQMAHLTADAADLLPQLIHIGGWVLFSAISTMQGNMGQSNYTAANQLLDATTFSMRTTNSDNFQPVTLMWGAIGDLGMRLKAFGSQDMLAMVDNTADVLMTPMEAKECLTQIVNGFSPEWVGAWKNTKEYNDHFMLGWRPIPAGKDPWGKGKGGGLSFAESHVEPSFQSNERTDHHQASQPSKQNSTWLFPGRRVRTHGLVLNAELNDLKGTLVEEAEPGVWHVFLDSHGEKLLKAHNLVTLSGALLSESDGKCEVETPKILKPSLDVKPWIPKKVSPPSISITGDQLIAPQELICIAGTWDDWMPQDMQWNAAQGCYTCKVHLPGTSDAKFGVNRGKAGAKKWAVRPKQWNMGNVMGPYQINVFMKNRQVERVEWNVAT